MDLKTHLMARIAVIAALCLVVAASYVLWTGNREMQRDTDRILDMVAGQLQSQLVRVSAGFDRQDRFPYLDPLVDSGFLAGFCIKFADVDGRLAQSSCSAPGKDEGVPAWFAVAYRAIFDPGREVARVISWREKPYGKITAAANVQGQIARAWHDVATLLGLTTITVLSICMLVYFAMARALRPTKTILHGFERLERGDLSARLPHFEPIELQKISMGFNRLAASLEETTGERAELMRKLVNVQEAERRFLARELHDEFGQCLAAVNAIATGLIQTAERQYPAFLGEGERLARIGAHMMEMLRGMFKRLRPEGLEELGLVGSVKGLVSQWNGGSTSIELEVIGSFDDLPEAVAVGVYRLIQECLTNVSKHAGATMVRVKLERCAPRREQDGHSAGSIDVVVEDNGVADAARLVLTPRMGLLGMRERVAALGGQLMLQARQTNGLVVRALLPVTPAA